jgi:hypothetical protein
VASITGMSFFIDLSPSSGPLARSSWDSITWGRVAQATSVEGAPKGSGFNSVPPGSRPAVWSVA